jgi:hypothetical protein
MPTWFELTLTAIGFGLIGAFSATRLAMTVLMLTSEEQPWARAVAYLAGSTVAFGIVLLLGVLGMQAVSESEQQAIALWLGIIFVVIALVMGFARVRRRPMPHVIADRPRMAAFGIGMGVSVQSVGRLLILLAGGSRIGALAASATVALAFAGLLLLVWQASIWGTMVVQVVWPSRFAALERRARPVLDHLEGGITGAVLVGLVGLFMVIRNL